VVSFHAPTALSPQKEFLVSIGLEASCSVKGEVLIDQLSGCQLSENGSSVLRS